MSGMTGTGLKKCMPTNRARRSCATASARRWIAIELVFEAKIAAAGAMRVELAPQALLDLEVLEDGLDDEVRVGDARRGRPSARSGPSVASRSSCVEPALRDRPVEVAGDPLAAGLGPGEVRLVQRRPAMPIAAWTWAMPWPISPAPATKTRSISVAMAAMVRQPFATSSWAHAYSASYDGQLQFELPLVIDVEQGEAVSDGQEPRPIAGSRRDPSETSAPWTTPRHQREGRRLRRDAWSSISTSNVHMPSRCVYRHPGASKLTAPSRSA